jgi:hypothetical protein
MIRFFSAFLLVLFVFTVADAQDSKPNIVVPQPTYDAGVVIRKGTPVEHAFTIKNTGTAELRILEVKPG